MKRLSTVSLVLGGLSLLIAPAPPAPAQELPDSFQNLRHLDSDIAQDELKAVMKGFTAALGVKCTFCHTIDEYHLDDNDHKKVARQMMKLVNHMRENAETYFAAKTDTELFECATCHRGEAELERWSPEEDEDWP